MNLNELAAWRPYLFHIMERRSQASARQRGLLSPVGLMHVAEQSGQCKWRWLGQDDWQQSTPHDLSHTLREFPMELQLPNETKATLRDQHALGGPNGLIALQPILQDQLTPQDWLGILNNRIFLFPCCGPQDNTLCEAGEKFRNANHPDQLTVLTILTARIPQSLQKKIQLSRINGGAINGMANRGLGTYVNLGDYPNAEANRIQEITVVGDATVDELRACCISNWFLQVHQ